MADETPARARASTSGPPPWDAVVLSRIRHLHLVARVLTDRLLTGAHRSRRVGQAIEFADYQNYVPGMDPRALDWRVLARSDRLVVRRYETETELPCTIVLDLSGDLHTGEAPGGYPPLEGTKAGLAITLAATLLHAWHRQGEPVGLALLGAEGPDDVAGAGFRWFPPRGGRTQLQRLFTALATARPGGPAGLDAVLREVGGRVPRRSLVTVVSDGMEEPAAWLPSLRAFGRRGADLRFVHVYDPAELRLEQHEGAALFYSPEGGPALAVDPAGIRQAFGEVVAAFFHEVHQGVTRAGGQYVPCPVDRPLETVARRLLHGRTLPAEPPIPPPRRGRR